MPNPIQPPQEQTFLAGCWFGRGAPVVSALSSTTNGFSVFCAGCSHQSWAHHFLRSGLLRCGLASGSVAARG
jgi:hypothetical protein